MSERELEKPPSLGEEMNHGRYRRTDLSFFAQRARWFDMDDVAVWFTGKPDRFPWGEKRVKEFSDKGKLVTRRYGNRKIYSAPIHCRGKPADPGYPVPEKYMNELEERYYQVEHGRAITKEVVRFWRSNMKDARIIDERDFKGLNSIADWAFRFEPSGSLLLGEHITEDYFYRTSLLKQKLTRYQESLPAIKERFAGNGTIVLFLIDVPTETVEKYVNKAEVGREFFFTSYEDFLAVPIGKAYSTPIYIWGHDKKTYALGKDG